MKRLYAIFAYLKLEKAAKMKKYAKLFLSVIFLIVIFNIFAKSQPIFAQSKADQINELLNRYYELGEFNGCVLVAEDGQIIYQKALGFADVDHSEPLTLNHGFRLASVSKQFTAMAVMILQERGKLDYENDIRQYIPELPYPNITIRHLLTHTSGLPDYGSLLEEYWDTAHKGLAQRRVASNKDALELLIEKQSPVDFKPGERQVYCNTGYMLLALIVERVSGLSFQKFMKNSIFQPLKMDYTYVNEPSGILPENQRAYGFKPNPEGIGFVPNDHHYQNGMFGDGGIISTVKDMFAWDQALYTEKLVRKTTLAEAFTPVILNDSSTVNYGFGWSIIPAEEGHILAHGGGWLSFQAFILRDIAARNTVILLSNMPGIRKDDVAFIIYDILHARKYALPVKGQITFNLDMRVPMRHHIFEPLNGDTVVLRGSFNGWEGNKEILTDIDRDSTYQITHNVIGTEGDPIEYKFVIHKSNGIDIWEQNPDSSNANYGNRRVILTENPQTLPIVKFEVDRYKLNHQGDFKVRELQQDFRQMRKALEESHPALYDYTDKKILDSLFDHYYQQIFPGMGFNDFYKILSAVLTINTFAYYEQLGMFKSVMDSAFQVIRQEKINNLIIELRGNDGGDPFCSSYLLSYLEHEPVPYFAESSGKYADLAKPMPLAQNHFKGNLYTLIDGGGFSTTGHFCALLKYHKLGKLEGTETGATYTCTGSVRYLNLKNSRLILGTARK